VQQLTKGLFLGAWKSYKIFLHSGEIKNHSKDKYLEFIFTDEEHLTIRAYENGRWKLLNENTDWNVIFKDKRHYLNINVRPVYEVITINHVALVLMEIQSLEKFFCARPQTWERYIHSPAASVL
jgi:hypothetical protein